MTRAETISVSKPRKATPFEAHVQRGTQASRGGTLTSESVKLASSGATMTPALPVPVSDDMAIVERWWSFQRCKPSNRLEIPKSQVKSRSGRRVVQDSRHLGEVRQTLFVVTM